jgi:DNA polymerase II large subunit
MDLTPEVTAKLIERAKLCKQVGEEAAAIIPDLLNYIDVMKQRLDAAMKREEEWKVKVDAAAVALKENESLKKQMTEMLDHPEVRAGKAARLAAQIEHLQNEQIKLLRAKPGK